MTDVVGAGVGAEIGTGSLTACGWVTVGDGVGVDGDADRPALAPGVGDVLGVVLRKLEIAKPPLVVVGDDEETCCPPAGVSFQRPTLSIMRPMDV